MTANAADILKFASVSMTKHLDDVGYNVASLLANVEADDDTSAALNYWLAELDHAARNLRALASRFGDPDQFSDGRAVSADGGLQYPPGGLTIPSTTKALSLRERLERHSAGRSARAEVDDAGELPLAPCGPTFPKSTATQSKTGNLPT